MDAGDAYQPPKKNPEKDIIMHKKQDFINPYPVYRIFGIRWLDGLDILLRVLHLFVKELRFTETMYVLCTSIQDIYTRQSTISFVFSRYHILDINRGPGCCLKFKGIIL